MGFCTRGVLIKIYPNINVHVINCSAKLHYHFVYPGAFEGTGIGKEINI